MEAVLKLMQRQKGLTVGCKNWWWWWWWCGGGTATTPCRPQIQSKGPGQRFSTVNLAVRSESALNEKYYGLWIGQPFPAEGTVSFVYPEPTYRRVALGRQFVVCLLQT